MIHEFEWRGASVTSCCKLIDSVAELLRRVAYSDIIVGESTKAISYFVDTTSSTNRVLLFEM